MLFHYANYIAGKAYEAKGCFCDATNRKEEAISNFKNSHENYNRAVIWGNKNEIADCVSVMYQSAVSRVSNRIDSLNNVKPSKTAKQSQKAVKSR